MRDGMNRHPIIASLLALAGLVMLLPGLCVIVLVSRNGLPDSTVVTPVFWLILWSICFAISALGVYFLVKVFC